MFLRVFSFRAKRAAVVVAVKPVAEKSEGMQAKKDDDNNNDMRRKNGKTKQQKKRCLLSSEINHVTTEKRRRNEVFIISTIISSLCSFSLRCLHSQFVPFDRKKPKGTKKIGHKKL